VNEISYYFFAIRADVAVPIGLLLAALVTAHVLLHKRETTSAAAWIGLSWFAPITGSIIYAVFGINRVQRRARRMRDPERRRPGAPVATPGDDDHLHPLQRGIARITGRPLLAGNSIAIFQNGDEAYPPMLEAIKSARHSIGMTSYIFRNDVWGQRFIQALTEAHTRGVQVRVLIDGIGGGWLRSAAWRHLRRNGVPAQRFLHSPLPWRMPFLNLRCHKKILVIDGTTGFTGGMNIADQNVQASHPKAPVQDTHFRLLGPIVCQLTEAFAQDWSFAAHEDLQGDAWFPDIPEGDQAPGRVIDSGPDEDIEKAEFTMLQAVSCARHSIAIMTPYFLPDGRLLTALSLAAMRGVAVDVIVPSKSDHRLVDFALRANSGPLLTDGVRIWRCPQPFRHSKMMVVDNEWSLIGSCNWDIRSFRLNFELCVEFYDCTLAGELTALMQQRHCNAFTLAYLDARWAPTRLRDAAARLLLPYL
jgi:cardiolipin synthase